MSAQPYYPPYLSEEDYLVTERRATFKSEYHDGEVFAMAGASYQHNLLTGNLLTTLNNLLADRECTVQASDMRLQVAESGLFTYPDVSVVCGEPQFRPDAHLDTLLNPLVLGEVLSRSTERYDQGGKLAFYRNIASLRHYLLVASDEVFISCYTRTGATWSLAVYAGLTAVVPLPALGIGLPLAEVYRKVRLPVSKPT